RSYLVADASRSKKLRETYFTAGRIAIGISWRSAAPRLGAHKTAQLNDFVLGLRSSDCDLVDLQYGDTSSEIAEVRAQTGIGVRHIAEIDNMNDIDGLASLIEACDCVVTVSNTTAHIAGALGKPVWILVPHGQGRHWYWFQGRRDSPWYPGARIVRQK